jgi:D-serine deaminase-like pyridoxal phosphate-dependent protein
MKRRSVLFGGLAGAAGLGLYLRPGDMGGPHSAYFSSASQALDAAGLARPTLMIDRARLVENITTLSGHIQGRFDYRIVAKSLPSLPLLKFIMERTGSKRLMLFHQPFVNEVAAHIPEADVLMGKPMPVAAARAFYAQLAPGRFNPAAQLRWLVDTPERVAQYRDLAQELQQDMRLCVELDVGLHRGGVGSDQQLLAMLDLISASPRLQFCGFMGYEPHIVKVPGDALAYRDKAMAVYSHYIELAKSHLGTDWPADVVLNAGGSPTYQMYNEGEFPFNELAAGSCLVKPTDFDLPSLADHKPASYIATPVLKSLDTLQVPGIDLGGLMSAWNPNRKRSFFTYGGYWKAQPESPPGLSLNPLLGRSTNQEMLNGSGSVNLQADDWVFLRPTQSEFVFLQFGDIAVIDQGQITQRWPVFSEESS